MIAVNRLIIAGVVLLGFVFDSVSANTGNTFTPYVISKLTYDDNLYKINNNRNDIRLDFDELEFSDTISSTLIGVNIDWDFSRQNFFIDASSSKNKYVNNSRFNNTGLDVELGWNYNINGIVTGSLTYNKNEQLASFVDSLEAALLSSTTKIKSSSASLYFNISPRWKLLLYGYNQGTSYSAPEILINDRKIDYLRAKLTFTSLADNSISFGLSKQEIDYVNRAFVESSNLDNKYHLSTLTLEFNYTLTDKSFINSNITWDQLEPQNLKAQSNWNVSDLGFNILYKWLITSRLTFQTRLVDEITPSENITANFQRSAKVSTTIKWSVLNTTFVTFGGDYEERTFEINNVDAFEDFSSTSNTYRNASIVISHQASRNFRIDLGYQYSSRRTDVLFRNFDSNTIHLTATAEW